MATNAPPSSASSSGPMLALQAASRRAARAARGAWSALRAAGERWVEVEAYRLASALAFAALLSILPLIVVILAVFEVLLGSSHSTLVSTIAWVDASGSPALRAALLDAIRSPRPVSGGVGIAAGLFGLVLGASGVFAELDTALNRIFRSETSARSLRDAVRTFLHERGRAFLAVAITSLLLLLATVFGVAWDALHEVLGPSGLIGPTSWLVSVSLLGAGLTVCMQWVPNRHVRWRAAARGGFVASILFETVRLPFSFAIVRVTDYAAYGVIGSVLVLLLWLYLGAMILLFGACLAAGADGTREVRLPRGPADGTRARRPSSPGSIARSIARSIKPVTTAARARKATRT